jgi:hypothetical protein
VFAHQGEGYGGCEAAERAWVAGDVYVVPCASVGKAGLESVSVCTMAIDLHVIRDNFRDIPCDEGWVRKSDGRRTWPTV